LFFPIFYEEHWFVFVVDFRDGVFVFLDCFFTEEHDYQKGVRDQLIRGFIRLWDNFVGHHCDFEKFTIHYPDLPMHTPFGKGYFRKGDDGIFAMKYMKIWDPCRNIMSQFSSRHINDFRVRYAYDIVMSKHTTP